MSVSFIYISPSVLVVGHLYCAQEQETDQDQLALQHFFSEFLCVSVSSDFATSSPNMGGHLCRRAAAAVTLPVIWQPNVIDTELHTYCSIVSRLPSIAFQITKQLGQHNVVCPIHL